MLSSFMVACMLSFSGEANTVSSPLLIPDSAELEEVKKTVLSWSNSLKSFKGCYSLTQQNYDIEGGGSIPAAFFEMEVAYRFEDKNQYMTLEMYHPDGLLHQNCAAKWNGVVQKCDTIVDDSVTERNYAVLEGEWPFPDGAYILPTDLFGWDVDTSLEKRFEKGETYFLKRDGMRVLSQCCFGDSFEIYVDEEDRVRKIDKMFRPAISLEELQTVWKQKEPFDVFLCTETLELDGYIEIDGVDFPTIAKRSARLYDREEYMKKCKARFDAEEISIYEFHMCMMELPVYVQSVMNFQLNPTTATLNKRLSKKDFKILLEDGTKVFNTESDGFYTYKTPWYARPVTWGIAVAVLLLLGGGGVFWYIQRPA